MVRSSPLRSSLGRVLVGQVAAGKPVSRRQAVVNAFAQGQVRSIRSHRRRAWPARRAAVRDLTRLELITEAVEGHDCPNCDAPAGSACRMRGGKATAKYHTPRFVLVPTLREEPEIPVPPNGVPAAHGSRAPRSRSCPCPAPSDPSESGTRGRRPVGRSGRAGSPRAGRSATSSSPSRSAHASG
ncbi:zinc finger domain-containing protein [Streptomyces marianii]